MKLWKKLWENRMKTNRTFVTPMIFGLTVLLPACSDNSKITKINPFPSDVEVANPIVKDVELWNDYAARIAPYEEVEVRSRISGYLDGVAFKKGDTVKKGELLFEIDDRPFSIAADAAQALVKATESKCFLAENNNRRAEGLYKKNAVSEEMMQTRSTELLVAKAKFLEAKANERNAKLNLEYTKISAPISGQISETFVDEGNLVNANSTILARIVNSDTVKAYFFLNENDAQRYNNAGILSSIKKGNGPKVELWTDNSPKRFNGNVGYFAPTLGRKTSSLKMCADIPNADGGLLAGMFATIRVYEGKIKNAILIPEDAIGTDLAGRYVLKVGKDSVVKYVPVKVGRLYGKMRIVEGGISPEDNIVIVGLQRAVPGRKVSAKQVNLR